MNHAPSVANPYWEVRQFKMMREQVHNFLLRGFVETVEIGLVCASYAMSLSKVYSCGVPVAVTEDIWPMHLNGLEKMKYALLVVGTNAIYSRITLNGGFICLQYLYFQLRSGI